MKEIYLAGGCFWGLQKYLANIPGVTETETGYANGKTENPSYEEVCRNNTGHAETVRIRYDSDILPLGTLLKRFFRAIDPTAVNRQGPDTGSQYRTGIYYTDSGDLETIQAELAALQEHTEGSVAVEAKPLLQYAKAEEYHQDYLDKNPGSYCHISPQKIAEAALPLT